MTTVNEFAEPILPVEVNFWWNENGPVETYTFAGNKYPYTGPEPPPAGERYIMHTTKVKEPIEFRAIHREGHEIEEETFPHVKPPKGVEVLDYIWDFGDGSEGYGPFVVHEYDVVQPGIEVKLTVIDSRGLIWSRSRPLNLSNYITPGFLTPQPSVRLFTLMGESLFSRQPELFLHATMIPLRPPFGQSPSLRFKVSMRPVLIP